jgi:RNA polymerase sigma-70 factor (ECF subfamily)
LADNVCKENTFSRIHQKWAKNLHDFLYYKFGSQYNPQDVVQEAFVKLWENCANVTEEKAKSFLFTVGNNLSINKTKHQKVVWSYEQENKDSNHTDQQDPSFLLEEKEYEQKLQKALAALSEEKRVTFLMCKVEGKKHQEIAEILGISQKAVEKRIYTALKELRETIEEL